jgi:membrane fusion protein, multidrug efflux system
MNARNHIVLIPAIPMALALGAATTGCREAHTAPAIPLPAVTVARVEEQKVAEWDEFIGRFDAIESVEIRPRVSGTIERVAFQEGKEVRKGDLLFQIDPKPYQAELARAEAGLAQARSAAALASLSLERSKRLIAAEATTREDFESRTSGAERGTAAVSAAEAAVATARLNLEWTKVRSPIRGRVGRAEITSGNLVQVGVSRLTSVVSLDPIFVYFDADERSYLKMVEHRRESREARTPVVMGMSDEDGRFPHRGYLDFVDNQIDPRTGTVRARAVFANKDQRFSPGLFARIKILDSKEYLAPVVSDRAIGTDQDKKFVLVLQDDDTLGYRPVELGRLFDGYRVIKSGLKAQEKIVINGLQRVRPGAKVLATMAPMLAEADTAQAIPANSH